MLNHVVKTLSNFFTLTVPDEIDPSLRYNVIKRNILFLMLGASVILTSVSVIFYYQCLRILKNEIFSSAKVVLNNKKRLLENYLEERITTADFIASTYTFDDVSRYSNLYQIYQIIKRKHGEIIDIEIIDSEGNRIAYAGPYDSQNINYRDRKWFNEVKIKGYIVSNVSREFGEFPSICVVVQRLEDSGKMWFVKITIRADFLAELMTSVDNKLDSESFLVSKDGICQTSSKTICKPLELFTMDTLPVSYEPVTIPMVYRGETYYVSYMYFMYLNYVLVMTGPENKALQNLYFLKKDFLLAFLIGFLIIMWFVFQFTSILVHNIKESDKKREFNFKEIYHHHKLSSISSFASSIAHEINNPLSIINEKAGLIKDLLGKYEFSQENRRLIDLVNSILKSVDRCRDITYKLLRFAKRMDVKMEMLDINEVIRETLSFLEEEALHRHIAIRLDLAETLPRIYGDRGQLQQVFLSILENAFEAVKDGGEIYISTGISDKNLAVTIKDKGIGMSEEVIKRIFEPFFGTKIGYGTGLGLSVTYGIVKKLGGDIKVESKEGEGTAFTVFLPIKSPFDTM